LPLEFGDFALKPSVLGGILCLQPVKLRAKFAVLHQKDEGDDGGGDQEDRDQENQQLSHGHWASLVVLDPLFPC